MWIETGRGERVRVEVFDFLSCQRSGEGVDTSRETAGHHLVVKPPLCLVFMNKVESIGSLMTSLCSRA
jgi:hypothetical protein